MSLLIPPGARRPQGSSPVSGRVWCPGVSGVHSACALSLSSRGTQDRVRIRLNLTWRFFFPLRNQDGNTYDLSSLSRYSDNWEAITGTGSTEHYLINVCKSLSPQAGLGEQGLRGSRLLGSLWGDRGSQDRSFEGTSLSDTGAGTH